MANGDTDYTDEEIASFGIWVELGAKNPDQQVFLDVGLSKRWERRDPSGSQWVKDLIANPVRHLLNEPDIVGVGENSRVTTTILHHERGLEHRIIKTGVVVELQSGDVAVEIDKEATSGHPH